MPRICDITGKWTTSGNNRSHSMRATRRTFKPNLVYKWVVMEDGRKVRVRIDSKLYKKMRWFI